jgi:acetylornithine deacetylase/succinyl-diaminopimelate desuccinylase-like protein
LAEYVQVDTTAPPGNEARAFPLLTSALREIGLEPKTTTIAENRGNVFARLSATNPDPGARPIILLHHIDVVPAEPSRWSVPPFGGLEKDGRLWGRGTLDTKCLGALQLATIERLAKARDRLRRDVIFLAVSDEEIAGLGAQHFVDHELEGVAAEYLLDEGGFSVRDFIGENDVVVIATAQKRGTEIHLVAKGEGGHGSRPTPKGGPSVLVTALSRLADHPTPMRVPAAAAPALSTFAPLSPFPQSFLLARLDWPGVLWMLSGTLSSNKNVNPMLRDTLALTMLDAGEKVNVIPSEARAVFDVRLLPDSRVDDVVAHIADAIGDLPISIKVVRAPLQEIPVAPTNDPLFGALTDAVRANEPSASVTPWMLVGVSDSRLFALKGVKTYGFNPIFVDKTQLDGIHGNDENVAIAELERGMKVYAEALERFVLRK